ncbi:MAG: carboxypeptidase-like regulatory domain-containing protein [Thermoanaerobaculia bacterium]
MPGSPISGRALRSLALLVAGCVSAAAASAAEHGTLSGRVIGGSSPLDQARVYAYQLAERSLRKVLTDPSGSFLFEDLPAGLYKLIAHKSGFEPIVRMVSREATASNQFVELELAERSDDQGVGPARTAADFWSLREQIPSDVLRDIELSEPPVLSLMTPLAPRPDRFLAEMEATTGVVDLANAGAAEIRGGQVGLHGQVGRVRMLLEGDFQQLGDSALASDASAGLSGETSSLRVHLAGDRAGRFDLASISSRLDPDTGEPAPQGVDYSQYQLTWNRPLGDDAETTFLAYYVSESGFYGQRLIDPGTIPIASRTLQLEGNYSQQIGDNSSLRSGVRYRERIGQFQSSSDRFNLLTPDGAQRFLDAFSLGQWRATPDYWIQYGIYSTLSDGSVSLQPRGGVLLHFGPDWQVSALAARRVALSGENLAWTDFLPDLFQDNLGCDDSEFTCYSLQVLHGAEEANHFKIGSSFREYDRPVRLFFSQNFFEHGESLFLVPGDRLPEVYASWSRRVAPRVVTRVSTDWAAGGGGSFRAVNRTPYENEIALLTTAVDTRFERTSTGLYVSFHRLSQRLEPLRWRPGRRTVPESQLDRLELIVSQDLSTLFDLSGDWALRVGMELSRGGDFFPTPAEQDTVRRRLMTGVAVRF